jgi:mono/diheme cytochrome c family protein
MSAITNTSKPRLSAVAAATAAVLLLGATPARAAGDVENGEALAQKWCASCHVISEAALAGMEALVAPTFMELKLESAAELKAALTEPHPFMPEFDNLTDQDVDDLLVYIHSVADE